MKDTAVKRMATVGQVFEITTGITVGVGKFLIESGLTFDQARKLIEEAGKKTMVETSSAIAGKLFELVAPDPFEAYKNDLERFFLDVYDIKLSLSGREFPVSRKFNNYMVVPPDCSAGNVYRKFLKLNVPTSRYIEDSFSKRIRQDQKRPDAPYYFAWQGWNGPDDEHLGKSYLEFISAKDKNYMSITEYMLCYQFKIWVYGLYLDEKSLTITSTVDRNGAIMNGFTRKSKFGIGSTHSTKKTCDEGPREIVIF